MGLIKKVKELEQRMNVNNNRRGYKFNKWVFNIMILLMFVLVLFVWAEYDFGDIKDPNLFIECELPNAICSNELYVLCNPNSLDYFGGAKVCEQVDPLMYEREFLYGGETLGQRPSFLANNISQLFILVIVGAFLINHFLFNKRGKKNV